MNALFERYPYLRGDWINLFILINS
jgi:hypothetical protein